MVCLTERVILFKNNKKYQTKPISKLTQMNVTKTLTTDYNRMDTWYRGKNKANSKPICSIKPQKSALAIWKLSSAEAH